MHSSFVILSLLSAALANTTSGTVKSTKISTTTTASTATASAIGYDEPGQYIPSSVNGSFNFGQHYAVLNLDLINGILASVANGSESQKFLNNTETWINAVHAQNPPPLSIFTRIYFANSRKPEIKPNGGFSMVSAGITTENSTASQLYPGINVDYAAGDVVLQKTGYYAGIGNELENILSAQSIDTVILSGIRTSGVILSTTYRLFDLGYKVYVIANNTIEGPPEGVAINTVVLSDIIPKIGASVITIEQALAALKLSGPAIY